MLLNSCSHIEAIVKSFKSLSSSVFESEKQGLGLIQRYPQRMNNILPMCGVDFRLRTVGRQQSFRPLNKIFKFNKNIYNSTCSGSSFGNSSASSTTSGSGSILKVGSAVNSPEETEDNCFDFLHVQFSWILYGMSQKRIYPMSIKLPADFCNRDHDNQAAVECVRNNMVATDSNKIVNLDISLMDVIHSLDRSQFSILVYNVLIFVLIPSGGGLEEGRFLVF